jgi:hypothetical protein
MNCPPASYGTSDVFRHAGLDPASRMNKYFWTPAFAGVTALMTFYQDCQCSKQERGEGYSFGHLNLDHSILFRISCFEFRILNEAVHPTPGKTAIESSVQFQ